MFTLTKAARKKLLEFIDAEGGTDEWGLSVSAGPGGNYGLELIEIEKVEAGTRIEGVKNAKGIAVFVDESSKMFVDGMVIDYVERLQGAGFKFENPNAPTSAFEAGGEGGSRPETSDHCSESDTAWRTACRTSGRNSPSSSSLGRFTPLLCLTSILQLTHGPFG